MFRILSLDGGGIKGTFTASILATLEDATGQRTQEHFDLITGTSTGGILAIGLGLGFSANELLDFYRRKGPSIFPATSKVERTFGAFKQIFKPKISHEPLENALNEIIGKRLFGDSKSRLVIPSYDATAGRIFLFKTAHHKRFRFDAHLSATEVALATSAAPTYFKSARLTTRMGAQYVDGGVWANNPAMVGIVEAISFLGQELNNIQVLSVGTTNSPFNIAKHEHSGAARWNVGLINLIMEGSSEAASKQAELLCNGNFHRIDCAVNSGEFSLDHASKEKIDQLVALGQAEATKKENLGPIEQHFLNGNKVGKFTPF